MAAPKRTKDQRIKDRLRIIELRMKGYYEYQIAEELKLSQQMISRELKKIRAEWTMNTQRNYEALINEELAQIAIMEREAWQEYERSKLPREVATRKKVKSANGTKGGKDEKGTIHGTSREEQSARKEGRLGDPRYLDIINNCRKRRAELLGLEAPKKIEHSGSIDMREKTDEELELIARGQLTTVRTN